MTLFIHNSFVRRASIEKEVLKRKEREREVYMATNFQVTGMATQKTNVHTFGVVIL
ncbi:putative lysM domain receptor-like kinase 3 [Sesbania bispinosa]|nr:putative lysM domain receptor-like kinase 3 [Sesbania bispinosa]